MKKILLTLTVFCCCIAVAAAQDSKKMAKKKAVSKTLLYNPSASNAARQKEKEAKAKAFEAGKVPATTPNSKASLAVDRKN